MDQDIINQYNQRAQDAQRQADYYKQQVDVYSLSRLGAFVVLLITIVVAATIVDYELLIASILIFALVFGWLVNKQNRHEVQLAFYKNLVAVNQNEISSIISRGNIYDNGAAFADEKHYYTSDLDIYGSASLFNLVNRAATTLGIAKLAEWLNAPSQKQTILNRQQAVQELASKTDWRLNFQADLLFALKQDKDQLKRLFAYLRLPVIIKDEKLLTAYILFAPWLVLASFAASAFYYNAIYVAAALVALNLRLAASHGSQVDKVDLLAGKIGKELRAFAKVFEYVELEEFTSGYCQAVADRVKNQQGVAVSTRIRALSRLINNLNARMNLLMGIILNALFVWNVKQIIAIENWKRANHENLETAFQAVGEFEALIGLTSLAANYPAWAFPQIADGDGYTLSAQSIAHPLINASSRVDNDFELNDGFHIDIITGSNMAGKSTFLRTLGINTVMALCGAPVCAKSMQVSVITIISYMRIKDSLNESTSTFKAELDRLQMLLNAVNGEQKVYFLIDEMLRGTNSVDKYKGSKAVIEQLIKKKGVGLVATHDLQIAQLEQKYPDYVRNFYFDIQVVDGEMLFDYKIKHGECKTFNASILLKQIGIDVDAG